MLMNPANNGILELPLQLPQHC